MTPTVLDKLILLPSDLWFADRDYLVLGSLLLIVLICARRRVHFLQKVPLPYALTLTCLAWLTVLNAVFACRSLHWPLITDAPLLHYIALRIHQGAAPYHDLFDMNMPGVYLLHLAILNTLGTSDAAWRLFDFMWLLLTDGLLWAYCRPQDKTAAGAAVLFFSAYHLAGGPYEMGQRDYLLFTFLLASAYLLATALDNNTEAKPEVPLTEGVHAAANLKFSFVAMALAGLMAGGGAMIKPLVVLWWIALAAVIVLRARRKKQAWAKSLAWFCAGSLAAPILCALWLLSTHTMGDFLEILIRFDMGPYVRLNRLSAREMVQMYPGTMAACLVFAVLTLRAERITLRLLLLLLGTGYGLLNYLIQGHGWAYHLYPLMGFACALGATLVPLARLSARPSVAWMYLLAVGGFCVILWDRALAVQSFVAAGESIPMVERRNARVTALACDLRPLVPLGGTVQVFDNVEGGIHALLRLQIAQPTRFIYEMPFYTEVQSPYTLQLRAQLLHDLQANPPDALVLFTIDWPGMDVDKKPPFTELRLWIRDNYIVAVRQSEYLILTPRWRRQPLPTSLP